MKLILAYAEQGVESYPVYYKQLHEICLFVSGNKRIIGVSEIKGVQLALVTRKGIHSILLPLKQFGLEPYFEMLETGSPEGTNKVKGIANVLKRLNAEAAEA